MTAKEIIKKYNIFLSDDGERIGTYHMDAVKKDGMLDTLKSLKPEIISTLKADKEAAEKAAGERRAKIEAIEGLKELEAAREAVREYHDKFIDAMDSGDGLFPPTPKVNIDDLSAKYPRANAYLTAESWSMSENYIKASAGEKALERIIDGENHETAIAEMKREWDEYCKAHMWD